MMAQLVCDCPRCPARHSTLDVTACISLPSSYEWQHRYECFSICRSCSRGSIMILKLRDAGLSHPFRSSDLVVACKISLENFFDVTGFISIRDHIKHNTPEHLPKHLTEVFIEAESCFGISCYNAAATMFRLCIDQATKPMLPPYEEGVPPTREQGGIWH